MINVDGIHHMTLTVSDVARSRQFYETVLGFKLLAELGSKTIMSNNNIVLALNAPPDPAQALPNDRFSEHRVGLDHVSFGVASRAVLEDAARLFDERNIPHGEINDLGPAGLPIYVLAFRDPDNIQLELTAPHG